MRRDFGVDFAGAEHVEGCLGLWEEFVLEGEGKGGVSAGEPGDEMIFK